MDPSQGRGRRISKWTLSEFKVNIIDTSMDQAQDMLSLLASAPFGTPAPFYCLAGAYRGSLHLFL